MRRLLLLPLVLAGCSSPDAAPLDPVPTADAPRPARHPQPDVDAPPPPPSTFLDEQPASPTASTTATFAFHADRPAGFECALDGAAFAPCASPLTVGDLAEAGHRFEVRAVAGGLADPTPALASWRVDLTPPDTTITDAPPADVAAPSASFAFTCSTPPCTFECSVDGSAFSGCDSPIPLSGLKHGAHVFEARATDAAGNVDPTPASHAWFVHLVPPATAIHSAPPDPTVIGSAAEMSFTFDCAEAGVELPCTFSCTLDGVAGACASPKTYLLGAGLHLFNVQATDAAGLVDPVAASYSWNVIAIPR